MDYSQFVEGAVHPPTQQEGEGFDLTVAAVREVVEPGSVDFGGGELASAGTEPHPSRKRDPDDDYEWWSLDPGQYLLEYNEALAAGSVQFTVQTRRELLARGAFHPTLHVTDLPKVPLSVGGSGIDLKENARVSTVVAAEPVPGTVQPL
ncbi:MAG: dCTP deaminase [Salinirussus sp.]